MRTTITHQPYSGPPWPSASTAKGGTYSSKSSLHGNRPLPPVASPPMTTASSQSAQSWLARVTAYWPAARITDTNHKMTATGVRLRDGFCAVDSRIIPYGSLVVIPGVGNFLAMDTGTAVISRKAAKESGHNRAEQKRPGQSIFSFSPSVA